MSHKTEIEELVYLKEGRVEDKLFFIFQNTNGELRAVEALKINLDKVVPGEKYTARVRRVGCSNRVIEHLSVQ